MHLEKINAWLKLEEMSQEEIVSALFGLTDTETKAYFTLLRESISVQGLSRKIKVDRTTSQRVLQTLINEGLAHRVVERKKKGGINYIYTPMPFADLKDRMGNMVDSWSAFIKKKIEEM